MIIVRNGRNNLALKAGNRRPYCERRLRSLVGRPVETTEFTGRVHDLGLIENTFHHSCIRAHQFTTESRTHHYTAVLHVG